MPAGYTLQQASDRIQCHGCQRCRGHGPKPQHQVKFLLNVRLPGSCIAVLSMPADAAVKGGF